MPVRRTKIVRPAKTAAVTYGAMSSYECVNDRSKPKTELVTHSIFTKVAVRSKVLLQKSGTNDVENLCRSGV